MIYTSIAYSSTWLKDVWELQLHRQSAKLSETFRSWRIFIQSKISWCMVSSHDPRNCCQGCDEEGMLSLARQLEVWCRKLDMSHILNGHSGLVALIASIWGCSQPRQKEARKIAISQAIFGSQIQNLTWNDVFFPWQVEWHGLWDDQLWYAKLQNTQDLRSLMEHLDSKVGRWSFLGKDGFRMFYMCPRPDNCRTVFFFFFFFF